MGGGHERGVTVWDIHRALAQQRYDAVCDELAQARELVEPTSHKRRERERELEAERLRLLARLGRLGPAPRAKMG
ncbi:MAG: hypothetical protein KGO05_01020 [Chloroflexota bacterium]|nr:hypothetical protein [Chloroflexota bacterium]